MSLTKLNFQYLVFLQSLSVASTVGQKAMQLHFERPIFNKILPLSVHGLLNCGHYLLNLKIQVFSDHLKVVFILYNLHQHPSCVMWTPLYTDIFVCVCRVGGCILCIIFIWHQFRIKPVLSQLGLLKWYPGI